MEAIATPILEVSVAGGVATLTLNRPERRNALSGQLIARLSEALDDLAEAREARVVVIAAAGPVFSSGHDLSEMVGGDESHYRDLFGRCSEMMLRIRRLPQPVIARVQGPATAAGCQLVASCDLAVASTSASFATPGVKIGLFCSTPMVPLSRAVGPKAAFEMLATGAPISADHALRIGLVNRVVPPEGLDDAVGELVAPILAASPATIRVGKAAFYRQLDCREADAYQLGVDTMTRNALHRDAQEGISAFLEKRRPEWRGD